MRLRCHLSPCNYPTRRRQLRLPLRVRGTLPTHPPTNRKHHLDRRSIRGVAWERPKVRSKGRAEICPDAAALSFEYDTRWFHGRLF